MPIRLLHRLIAIGRAAAHGLYKRLLAACVGRLEYPFDSCSYFCLARGGDTLCQRATNG